MNKLLYCFAFVLVMVNCQSKPVDKFTTQMERNQFIVNKTHFIDSVFKLQQNIENEKAYQSAFWASELMLKKSPSGFEILKQGLSQFYIFSANYKRSILQHAYTLYTDEFNSEFDSLIQREHDEKLFAIMASYLIRNDKDKQMPLLKLMYNRFPTWREHPLLIAFSIDNSTKEIITEKQIAELIAFRKKTKESSFFVFVTKNRDVPGILMIQNASGEMLNENGDTLKFRILARSITNLPEYITNGNTPQGVYSVQGFSSSDNIFIGKSPTIITALPFEVSVSEFIHEKKRNDWSLDEYNRLFPESWKSLTKKNMAYYAGKAGRSEIIIHGTTIDTEFYKSKRYYPFTPSLGCLCLLERWNFKDGSLIESEQLRLVKALKSNNLRNGLMYVIEK